MVAGEMSELVASLKTSVPAKLAERFTRWSDLAAALEAAIARAHRAYPKISVPPPAFAAFLGNALQRSDAPSATEAVEELPIEDLYLACALGRGDPFALVEFQRTLNPVLRRTARGIDPDRHFVDEVTQRAQIRMLVGENGSAPRILAYDGRGPLKNWLIGSALWLARDLKRVAGRPMESGGELQLLDLPASEVPAELSHLRSQQGPVVERAFREALAALDVKERNILRMHFVEGVGISAIGKLHQVHRSTVSRWVVEARTRILEAVTSRLKAELSLTPSDLRSLIRMFRSNLQLGLSRILPPGP
jgi:RNA polymerase sigma-70 factor, ECF subfamily